MTDERNFLLLIDNSGSMYGEKIFALNLAVSNFITGLKNLQLSPKLAMIPFGGQPRVIPFTDLNVLTLESFEANGRTRLTDALFLAQPLITPETVVVLFSDGAPDNGDYIRILRNITLQGQIFALSIGYDADTDMLARFTGDAKNILFLSDAVNMAGYIYRRQHEANN